MSPLRSTAAVRLVAGREIRTRFASKAFKISSAVMVVAVVGLRDRREADQRQRQRQQGRLRAVGGAAVGRVRVGGRRGRRGGDDQRGRPGDRRAAGARRRPRRVRQRRPGRPCRWSSRRTCPTTCAPRSPCSPARSRSTSRSPAPAADPAAVNAARRGGHVRAAHAGPAARPRGSAHPAGDHRRHPRVPRDPDVRQHRRAGRGRGEGQPHRRAAAHHDPAVAAHGRQGARHRRGRPRRRWWSPSASACGRVRRRRVHVPVVDRGRPAAWAVVWFLLGYLMYALVFAALGALVSRQEDVGGATAPAVMLIVLPYVVGVIDPAGRPGQRAGGAAVADPVLRADADADAASRSTWRPVWEIALSLALTVRRSRALAWFAGRIYRNAVLRTGRQGQAAGRPARLRSHPSVLGCLTRCELRTQAKATGKQGYLILSVGCYSSCRTHTLGSTYTATPCPGRSAPAPARRGR